jgi:type IV fimbrial biogenesis protein FimT
MKGLSVVRGISLLEMLIVITLTGIFAAFAVPALSDLVERNRTRALADLLRSSLAQARAHSVVTQQDMLVCGSSDGVGCDGGWSTGWLVISPLPDAEPISVHQLSAVDRLHWQGFSGVIRFRSNGTAPLSNGRFVICRGKQGVAWQLVMNRQGRARLVEGLEEDQSPPAACQ